IDDDIFAEALLENVYRLDGIARDHLVGRIYRFGSIQIGLCARYRDGEGCFDYALLHAHSWRPQTASFCRRPGCVVAINPSAARSWRLRDALRLRCGGPGIDLFPSAPVNRLAQTQRHE